MIPKLTQNSSKIVPKSPFCVSIEVGGSMRCYALDLECTQGDEVKKSGLQ